MAAIFFGISGDISKKIDKWINAAGVHPDVFSEKDNNLYRYTAKLLGKYEVVSLDEALKRYPGAEVWVTYRKADNTAKMLLKKLSPDRIHFLEADLEYRKGCRYLGRFISYRKNSFSPCCITGEAPIVRTSGSIRQRLAQWQDYTVDLVDNVRGEKPNDCEKCHMLAYRFWPKSVRLNEINFGSNQPGDVCNFRCTYCFCEDTFKRLKNSKDGFSTYEIMRQLAEMPEYDTDAFTVQLANGEFCANKHCDEMLDILLETKWKIILLSNLSLYKEKLAILMDNRRISKLTTSLDAGTRETFKKIKRVDAFDKVTENFKKYPMDKTNFLIKYIFLEGVNDNEADIDGYYEIVKEIGGIVTLTSNLNAPYTEKMRELALRLIRKAKTDGVKVDSSSSYLSPKDAVFIAESYAGA